MSDQPKIGELVLHCVHIPKEGNVDVVSFQSEVAQAFHRKDGSRGLTHWILCCKDCFAKAEGDLNQLNVPVETIWNNKITFYPEN
jgi:hypothetical protein